MSSGAVAELLAHGVGVREAGRRLGLPLWLGLPPSTVRWISKKTGCL